MKKEYGFEIFAVADPSKSPTAKDILLDSTEGYATEKAALAAAKKAVVAWTTWKGPLLRYYVFEVTRKILKAQNYDTDTKRFSDFRPE